MSESTINFQFSGTNYQEKPPFLVYCVDGVIVFLALLISVGVYFRNESPWLVAGIWSDSYLNVALLGVVFFYLIGALTNIYTHWRLIFFGQEMARVWSAWTMAAFAVMAMGSATKTSGLYSRIIVFSWLLITPVLLTIWRLCLRRSTLLVSRTQRIRTVVAGYNAVSIDFAKTIDSTEGLAMDIQGYYDDRVQQRDQRDTDTLNRRLGSLSTLVADARDGKLDLVYINLPLDAQSKVRMLISQLADTTVSVYYLLPNNMIFNLLQPQWHNVGGHHAVSVFESPFAGKEHLSKRVEDVVIGSLILLLISLPMVLIALAVKLTSRGPVFFNQKRYGYGGKEFQMFKFRSMSVMEDGDTVTQVTKNDVRVTALGRILRKYSLDELPQFLNVLHGDMSIVGPRPHAVAHNEEHRTKVMGYMLRHKVKPGITGLAQINGYRGETDTAEKMEKRVECDLSYIRSWSLWLDIKIIFISIFRGFTSPGAY